MDERLFFPATLRNRAVIGEVLEEFFDILDSACHSLQEETNCPDEAINQLLAEAIGTWQLPNIEQLDEALRKQNPLAKD